ncbi:hypothetical protein CGLAUT_04180 [Corynebacterium glaucum]|nr:hypothetical protein CGLAUT_04180 [Corynebacterium glaucum]
MAGYVATVSRSDSNSKREQEGEEDKALAASGDRPDAGSSDADSEDDRKDEKVVSSSADDTPPRAASQNANADPDSRDVSPLRRFMERTLGWSPNSGR